MKHSAFRLLFVLILFSSFLSVKNPPGTEQKASALVLIISSFDADQLDVRKNKRELFHDLSDSLKVYLSAAIRKETGEDVNIWPQLISSQTNPDSVVLAIIRQQSAGKAVLIRSLDAYFDESGDHEYTNDNGKQKVAVSYDLCTRIGYTVYTADSAVLRPDVVNCKQFTERSVSAKFSIRFGPDIVGKRKHTYGAVMNNANKFVSNYYRN